MNNFQPLPCGSILETVSTAFWMLSAFVTSIRMAFTRHEQSRWIPLTPVSVRHVAITLQPSKSSFSHVRRPKPVSHPVMRMYFDVTSATSPRRSSQSMTRYSRTTSRTATKEMARKPAVIVNSMVSYQMFVLPGTTDIRPTLLPNSLSAIKWITAEHPNYMLYTMQCTVCDLLISLLYSLCRIIVFVLYCI